MSATIAALVMVAMITGATFVYKVIDRVVPKRRITLPVDPEAILSERFAKGEIDEAEYGARLSVLRVGPPLMLPGEIVR